MFTCMARNLHVFNGIDSAKVMTPNPCCVLYTNRMSLLLTCNWYISNVGATHFSNTVLRITKTCKYIYYLWIIIYHHSDQKHLDYLEFHALQLFKFITVLHQQL